MSAEFSLSNVLHPLAGVLGVRRCRSASTIRRPFRGLGVSNSVTPPLSPPAQAARPRPPGPPFSKNGTNILKECHFGPNMEPIYAKLHFEALSILGPDFVPI